MARAGEHGFRTALVPWPPVHDKCTAASILPGKILSGCSMKSPRPVGSTFECIRFAFAGRRRTRRLPGGGVSGALRSTLAARLGCRNLHRSDKCGVDRRKCTCGARRTAAHILGVHHSDAASGQSRQAGTGLLDARRTQSRIAHSSERGCRASRRSAELFRAARTHYSSGFGLSPLDCPLYPLLNSCSWEVNRAA